MNDTLWQQDESRAELNLECGSQGVTITVYSCYDTLEIKLDKTGKLEINANGNI